MSRPVATTAALRNSPLVNSDLTAEEENRILRRALETFADDDNWKRSEHPAGAERVEWAGRGDPARFARVALQQPKPGDYA